MEFALPEVTVIAATEFYPLALRQAAKTDWVSEGHDPLSGEALIEASGRACYRSWSKPNPKTAANPDYIRHILEVGHQSVIEHATVTMYISGISRSLSHELVRHRAFSFSQASQRYIDESDARMVLPPGIAKLPVVEKAVAAAQAAYTEVVALMAARLTEGTATARRKEARQAARAVLPNATETHIVVTGNYRAWRHFLGMRATEFADPEIRGVAILALDELVKVAPTVFGDFTKSKLADGSEIATPVYGCDMS